MLHLVQIDGIVGISAVSTCEMPSGCRMTCPISSMRGCWPDHERIEASAGRRDAFD